jgi:hypothetical protein
MPGIKAVQVLSVFLLEKRDFESSSHLFEGSIERINQYIKALKTTLKHLSNLIYF